MSNTKPINFFEDNIKKLSIQLSALTNNHKKLSFYRIVLFVLISSLIIYFANARQMEVVFATLAIGLTAFAFLIRHHNRVSFRRHQTTFLVQINQEEVDRINGNTSKLNDGMQFFDKDHFYSPDLDVFGSNSLFQFLSRSRLHHSQSLLSKWLLEPSEKEDILSRQKAVKELEGKTEWRQKLTAYGMISDESFEEIDALLGWLNSNDSLSNRKLWQIASFMMPVISLIICGAIIFSDVSFRALFFPVIINLALLGATFNRLKDLTQGFEHATKFLKSYQLLIQSIESEEFSSPMLKKARAKILGDVKASKVMGKLGNILYQLQNRINMLYIPFNIVFALDLFWLTKAEKWKESYGPQVQTWFDVVYTFDVLSDLASFKYANPDFVFPEIHQPPFTIDAIEMGHPLIHHGKRTTNDFQINGAGQLGLITGSNMSGKSTFLRTLGINVVLAQSGAPVCAKSMNCSSTRVFTSMRTQDNLEESISSFYAELTRIKKLLDSIDDKSPILFLLDEILKGTNSDDRHKGAIALIQQLTAKNATGLISTHDLSLSKLESKNPKVQNYSFNSQIINDDLVFDYKLSEGPCTSFNASKLMEKMGIII